MWPTSVARRWVAPRANAAGAPCSVSVMSPEPKRTVASCNCLRRRRAGPKTNNAINVDPTIRTEPATSAIVGPHDDVEIPPGALKVDWEVELGVVIGSTARYVSREQALDHVAGYCIVNDVSERAYQLERGGQWDKGKGCDTFGPLGPWMVTRDEVPDPQALDMWLEVDGKRYQNGNTHTMIFDVATLVSYISQFMSLQPGDVISTGTPPGVGMGQKPAPVYLSAGQVMRLGIAGLGEQQQKTIPAKIQETK